jgi:phytoene/squalene synthetase
MTPGHYENFPVGSIFLPRRLRAPIRAIYAFARSADDFADEGDDPAEVRLAKLAAYHVHLDTLERSGSDANAVEHPIFKALAPHIRQFNLPYPLFHELLSAFEQDCTKIRSVVCCSNSMAMTMPSIRPGQMASVRRCN